MDQNLRASIQSSTFYYFTITMTLTTISQLTIMSVIVFADIAGKENVVAASVIGPALLGAFGIIRLLTNMTYIVADMDKDMKATKYGASVSGIPFPVLKIVFAAIFVIIALVVGPDSVGFDPTYGPITAILSFVIAFLTTGVLMGIYVVFDVKQTFDLSHMHNILFVSVTVQMLFSLGSVFNYYSVFDTVLDTDTVVAISGSFTNTVFFLYGLYVYLLVRTDKRRTNLLSNRTQTIGTVFAAIIIPAQALTLFGLIPAPAFAGLFVLGGVVLYPLFIIGVGDAIGSYSVE